MCKLFFRSIVISAFFLVMGIFQIHASNEVYLENPELSSHSGIVKRESVPDQDLVILTLKNGLKIALKKTSNEEEILVRLIGLGGYSSWPESQKATGQFTAQAAIRSGIGEYHFDQLHALMFDKSIEFSAEILPFSRYVGGIAEFDGVETLMKLIQLFFTQHNLTKHSFQKVMEKAKEQLNQRKKNPSNNFVDAYLEFNYPKVYNLKTFTLKDIEQADYNVAVNIYSRCFKDPSAFVGVIVGSFDMETMVSYVDWYFSTIPGSEEHTSPNPPILDLPNYQNGIKSKVVKSNTVAGGEAVTALTFPVQVQLNQETTVCLENVTQLIAFRLKKVLRERYGSDHVIISVSPDFPYYPSLASPTIKIQYYTDPKKVIAMKQTILAELNKLQTEGGTAEELGVIHGKFRKSQRLRENDNCYWLTALSNSLLLKWDINNVSTELAIPEKNEKIQNGLKNFFSLDRYTVISGQP